MMKAAGSVLQAAVDRGRPWLTVFRVRERLLHVLSLVGFVGIWWVVGHFGSFSPYILPSPEKAGGTFLDELISGRLADNLLKSARHYTLGLTWGVSVGIVLGVATARSRTLEHLLGP